MPFGLPSRIALAAAIAVASAAPAHSAGLFEMIFGGGPRFARAPEPVRVIEPPLNAIGRSVAALGDAVLSESPPAALRSGGTAYCVRACDGRYFPVQAQAD